MSWLASQDKEAIRAIIKEVMCDLDINKNNLADSDQEYLNHQRYCKHMEAYLLLKFSIKNADIDLLRQALRQATILFNTGKTKTPRYAQALLYTLHIVDSPAADVDLQRSVLANIQGARDTNFELDRLLELFNNKSKTYRHERTNLSAPESDKLLQRWALEGSTIERLKDSIQLAFSRAPRGRHPPKSAQEDIFSMALVLSECSIIPQNGTRSSEYPAIDLIKEGMTALPQAIVKYNESFCSRGRKYEFDEQD